MKSLQIQFRNYDFRFRKEKEEEKIFDIIRKKFVALTPEEFVRQNILHHLVFDKHYPKGLISIETGLKVFELNKRTDLIVFDKNAKPFLLIECKAPAIKVTQAVLDQVSRYNLKLKAPFIVVSNGNETLICKINFETEEYIFLQELPAIDGK
ncbi:MAG TPA: restriction endonuclease subunit R [Bacteroidetes bacterium]|nr:restriction endonuclease subunit R [Bacteroidota bacterium]